ncbi:hypothetical protein AQUCO_01700585v1 [Aquilegia coerulea]|uniref:Uncharacterized protein n=1 Tax=Aquilegia coerulea TaxID=218851 RepID=A0A2G5DNR4_AQUCA|nr:hypothetical protein AQUCO_01700585v1 [Aquilegia coerulea]
MSSEVTTNTRSRPIAYSFFFFGFPSLAFFYCPNHSLIISLRCEAHYNNPYVTVEKNTYSTLEKLPEI